MPVSVLQYRMHIVLSLAHIHEVHIFGFGRSVGEGVFKQHAGFSSGDEEFAFALAENEANLSCLCNLTVTSNITQKWCSSLSCLPWQSGVSKVQKNNLLKSINISTLITV